MTTQGVTVVMLSHPFSTVCPGVRGGILTALAHTEKPLTGRTVAALTQPHASLRTVQTALDDLVLNGVVLREYVGRAHSYTLNRSHLAAPAVLALANLRQALLDRIRTEVSAWVVESEATWLFGSAARGDGDPRSDIDLLIVRPDHVDDGDLAWLQQVSEISEHVHDWTGNACEILELSVKELNAAHSRDDRLIGDLRRDAVHLTGRTPRATLRQTATK
jgi:predicted nucleotidyltransferase